MEIGVHVVDKSTWWSPEIGEKPWLGESQYKTWNNKRVAALYSPLRVLTIYTLLILVILATTLYLLVPLNHESTVQPLFNMIDNDLLNRMERAHHIYSKVLENRKKLIDHFGPTPKDIPV